MSAWGPNGLPPGVNLGGAIGGGFVQPERLPVGKAFHEVDTAAPRIPDRLASSFTPSYELAPTIDLSAAIVPKPERTRVFSQPKLRDPDEVYVPEGYIDSLARKKRLRYSDDD